MNRLTRTVRTRPPTIVFLLSETRFMAAKSWYLFTYDIRDDKRLRKVAKIIEPVDDLLVIGLCGACIDRIRSLNGDSAWPDDPHGTLIL